MKFSPFWITGITDSEGNFSINVTGNKITYAYKVTQEEYSIFILYALKFATKLNKVADGYPPSAIFVVVQ